MWYQNRYELDRISEAGRYHYFAENGNPVVRMNASFWLECEKDDTAFTQPAINTGNWEAWVATAIMRELHESSHEVMPTFVDVGANNGYYTLMAASAGFEVCSFEPNPVVCDMVQRSLFLNNCSEVFLNQAAVSDKYGKAQLSQHENHSGANSLEGDKDYSIEVDVVTLDDSIPEYYPEYVTLIIKVDVEGHERNVWRGAREIRETTDNIWFLEWVPCRHGIEYNREWLTEVLETHDLQMVNYDGSLRPVGIEEVLEVEFETIVFRKRN